VESLRVNVVPFIEVGFMPSSNVTVTVPFGHVVELAAIGVTAVMVGAVKPVVPEPQHPAAPNNTRRTELQSLLLPNKCMTFTLFLSDH
jgi:hypothetical protein